MKRNSTAVTTAKETGRALEDEVQEALAWLESHGTAKCRDEMGPRYGIHAAKAFGVSMADIQRLAKVIGKHHELALALWETGWYEARLLVSFIAVPERVTPALMDRWCRDFDNWGVCDTICFHLFDRTPHAFGRIAAWSKRRPEFTRRGAFALLACVALHDRSAGDEAFLRLLPVIEAAADDERNFVKKGVSWALRAIGTRSAPLKAAALETARHLAESADATARWIGKDAIKAFSRIPSAARGGKKSGEDT